MTDYQRLITRLRELAPFPDDAAASRAFAATTAALAEVLTSDEREHLTRSFPADLERAIPATQPGAPLEAGRFFSRVASAEGVPLWAAVEHAEVVCRALGEHMPPAERRRLNNHLPFIGALFEPSVPAEAPVHAASSSNRHDLAEGHAGGRHPLADASSEHLAHRHSVARNVDPHAETRLSTARGLTQEREEETLATGISGSRRPVSRDH